jgi:decaprenylphospho-beta-D-ribofuranose 2-oxidase
VSIFWLSLPHTKFLDMQLTNWGKYPVVDVPVQALRGTDEALPEGSWIARGLGRCYGDSALGAHVISTTRLNRLLSFDADTGVLDCEAGVSYADLLAHFVPRGWFPPVTPGTKFVTMGGAVASDVHGKNHHVEGSFGQHVIDLDLLTPGGERLTCSRDQNRRLFLATLGGMGLTGLITRVRLRLRRIQTSAIKVQHIKAVNLDEIFTLFDRFDDTTYSVAWIDVLGRGKHLGRSILMQGEHATGHEVAGTPWEQNPLRVPQKVKFTVPFDLPAFVLNHFTIRAFNTLYYGKQLKKEQVGLVDYDSFFYPLDTIHHWNRIYGRRGFTQYQFVLPKDRGAEGMQAILQTITQARMGSFLSVLKLFGPAGEGLLSFPMSGYTLTLDFPITPRLFPFLDKLDELVLQYGGRVYLTKDVRLTGDTLARMYPQLPAFREVLAQINPEGKVRSLQAERLGLV